MTTTLYILLTILVGFLLGITIRHWEVLPIWLRVFNVVVLVFEAIIIARFFINYD